MKITNKHLSELRQCELYQKILPRYQKNIEWLLKKYIEMTEQENIKTKVYFITDQENGSIKVHSPLEAEINQRRLLNLNETNFEFGLEFLNDTFMPFFGEKEIALFSSPRPIDEIDNGDICLVKYKPMNIYFLTTKEETGFFELNCNYLCNYDEAKIEGILVNIETR